jgi:hypothetical protein
MAFYYVNDGVVDVAVSVDLDIAPWQAWADATLSAAQQSASLEHYDISLAAPVETGSIGDEGIESALVINSLAWFALETPFWINQDVAGGLNGSLAVTLDNVSLASGSTIGVGASSPLNLANTQASGSAALGLSGAVSITLGDVTLAGSGSLLSGIGASASLGLDGVSVNSNATLSVKATAGITLAGVSLTSLASLGLGGTFGVTLAGAGLSSTGLTVSGPVAAQNVVLDGVTVVSTASLTGDAVVPSVNRGDDALRRKRPVIVVRPKVERELEEILELVEDVEPQNRTSVKRAAIKQAREAFRAVEIPSGFEQASQAISAALARVSRAAGELQGFQAAAMVAAQQIEALIAEMERKRIRRRREEEIVVSWFLS